MVTSSSSNASSIASCCTRQDSLTQSESDEEEVKSKLSVTNTNGEANYNNNGNNGGDSHEMKYHFMEEEMAELALHTVTFMSDLRFIFDAACQRGCHVRFVYVMCPLLACSVSLDHSNMRDIPAVRAMADQCVNHCNSDHSKLNSFTNTII